MKKTIFVYKTKYWGLKTQCYLDTMIMEIIGFLNSVLTASAGIELSKLKYNFNVKAIYLSIVNNMPSYYLSQIIESHSVSLK